MVLSIINVIAIIVIPILAVIIAQHLQDRSEKRKDKMKVFSHLMSYRSFDYVDINSVNIFNSIPIVFHDDENVLKMYNNYLQSLNITPEEMQHKRKEIDNNKTKMLESMAKALKYKNINWETIQNPYVPIGLLNQIQQENLYKQGQVEIAKVFTQMTDVNTPIDAIKQYGIAIEEKIVKNKKEQTKKGKQ